MLHEFWADSLPTSLLYISILLTRLRYNIASVSLYDSLRFGYGTITSGITFSILSPDSMVRLTFSYSRLYEYLTYAVLQSSGLSRNVGTLEKWLVSASVQL